MAKAADAVSDADLVSSMVRGDVNVSARASVSLSAPACVARLVCAVIQRARRYIKLYCRKLSRRLFMYAAKAHSAFHAPR
jgi:hypothetical protein